MQINKLCIIHKLVNVVMQINKLLCYYS